MAQFIDQKPEELEEGEEFATLDEAEVEDAPEEPTLEAPEEQYEEDGIPDKYRGKDIKDIVQMHQEAEKLLGRQSSEVGELRRIVDDFVKSQINTAQPSPQQETDEDFDFFSDPDKAVAKAIENHPTVRQAEAASIAMQQQSVLAQLQSNHPDFIQVVQDAKFQDWVSKSKVRTELYERADKRFDFDAANELISSWKERQNIVTETAQMQQADRKRQLKSASTGNTSGSSEAPSRKVYRRADIIKLMQNDPDRYMQLAEDIRNAYAEGRVK